MSFYPFFKILSLPFSEEALSVRIYWELESSTQCSCVVKMMQKLLKRSGYKESSGTLGCHRGGTEYGCRRTRLVLGNDPHVHAQRHLTDQCCPHCVFSRGFPLASHICCLMDAKRLHRIFIPSRGERKWWLHSYLFHLTRKANIALQIPENSLFPWPTLSCSYPGSAKRLRV